MSEIQSYNWEKENFSYIRNLPELPLTTQAWQAFSRPNEINVDWHRTENQGAIGSCQGNGLSSALERLAFIRGESVQLSRIFAYLATQAIDGLLGSDAGSTISGGGKLATQYGCCLESATGYPSSYPGRSARDQILSKANYTAAKPFVAAKIWQVPRDHDKTLDFIGGGGTISFGVKWYNGMIPRDRVVRQYQPGWTGGGHAMCVLGYDRDGNLRAFNSWGDGLYLITPTAWAQMLNHSFTAAIGLTGDTEAKPVDWYNNSPYYKLKEKPDAEN